MGACWYRVLRLLISHLLRSGTQSHVASDEMHAYSRQRGVVLCYHWVGTFLCSNLPPTKLASRFQKST